MLSRICRTIRAIGRCRKGNTALLVALGMPVLIGGVGMGVDVAQWYMWKRELQYAVDQAAIAGAWARTDEDTQETFEDRARQEFSANLSVLQGTTTEPAVSLANFAGGVDNSVVVSANTSRELPFTSFFMDSAADINAYAQASFSEGATFTSCLIALDEDESGAVTIGGTSVLTAGCGLAALSTSDTAITVNGTPTIDAGWIISAGGIDDWLKENTDDTIMEYMSGLYDPFEELSPPNPAETQVQRTYSCAATPDSTVADISKTIVTSYSYWRGINNRNAVQVTYDGAQQSLTETETLIAQTVPNGTTEGYVSEGTTNTWTSFKSGQGNQTIHEKKTVTTTATHTNVVVTPGIPTGTVQPGTYTGIHVSCDTIFRPGVYVIDGGGLQITGQYEVTGSAVMFVLKNGAWIDIAGGADINLTAMQASDLISRGVPAVDANKLAGMLVFEDRDSDGSSKTKINGNANTLLNGTIYLPVSSIDFAGTAGVSSQCLMIAAAQINLTGNANMTTFCPPSQSSEITVVNTKGKVKLVA